MKKISFPCIISLELCFTLHSLLVFSILVFFFFLSFPYSIPFKVFFDCFCTLLLFDCKDSLRLGPIYIHPSQQSKQQQHTDGKHSVPYIFFYFLFGWSVLALFLLSLSLSALDIIILSFSSQFRLTIQSIQNKKNKNSHTHNLFFSVLFFLRSIQSLYLHSHSGAAFVYLLFLLDFQSARLREEKKIYYQETTRNECKRALLEIQRKKGKNESKTINRDTFFLCVSVCAARANKKALTEKSVRRQRQKMVKTRV